MEKKLYIYSRTVRDVLGLHLRRSFSFYTTLYFYCTSFQRQILCFFTPLHVFFSYFSDYDLSNIKFNALWDVLTAHIAQRVLGKGPYHSVPIPTRALC